MVPFTGHLLRTRKHAQHAQHAQHGFCTLCCAPRDRTDD